MPKLSLSGSVSHTEESLSQSIGLPQSPALSRNGSIGINITIPLFEGFARDSFKAAEWRYQSGVGLITDVLTTQTALATAEQQYIQAEFDWRTARIQLALALGSLGLSDVN